ncbi:MAG: class I SAM-dependent methyltransferase, partial [Proteobacteria bacterium]|nr:class I SAM-dependent methyltransferase [Pseudomonadota bacterium]
MHKGEVLDNAGGYSIIDCTECGFVHIDPLPSAEELDKIYSDEYYSEEKPEYIDCVIKDIEWWNCVFDSRYSLFESRLPAESRSVLDVGCGPGYFLKHGQERGWKTLGIEPSVQAAKHAEGLGVEVVNAFLDSELCASFKEKHKSFDAVHLSEVLEHTRDPLNILCLAHDLLDDSGIICTVVPNDYSPVQHVLRDKLDYSPYWLAPPHHINYFTFDSMASLMRKAGFEIIETSAMFP